MFMVMGVVVVNTSIRKIQHGGKGSGFNFAALTQKDNFLVDGALLNHLAMHP